MTRAPNVPAAELRLMRAAARLAAVQALFQMEASGAGLDPVLEEFQRFRMGETIDAEAYRDWEPELFRALVRGAVDRQAEIDQLAAGALDARWPISRIDPTLRATLRAAGAELLERADTPARVIVAEFVDIARAFFPEGKEAGFVNAVLDKMARTARAREF